MANQLRANVNAIETIQTYMNIVESSLANMRVELQRLQAQDREQQNHEESFVDFVLGLDARAPAPHIIEDDDDVIILPPPIAPIVQPPPPAVQPAVQPRRRVQRPVQVPLRRVAPVSQAPIAPVVQVPIAPVVQVPIAPVVQVPIAPIVDPYNRRVASLVTFRKLSHRDYYKKMSEPCPICFEDYTKGVSTLTECNHNLCHGCLYNIMAASRNVYITCPFCRHTVKNITNYCPLEDSRVRVKQPHKEIREKIKLAAPHCYV